MTEATPTLPPGYWQDASGNLVPDSKVKDVDKVRHELVVNMCQQAQVLREQLAAFKLASMANVAAFVSMSMETYGVKSGGNKGNVTLTSYDGKYKLVRQMADRIVFGPELMAAKALIDECVHVWAKEANDNIKALVNHAFQTDKEGKINTGRVLGLRRLDIRDAKWQQAMQAIADSMQTASTTPYIRFYVRNDTTQNYTAIPLDMAGV